MAGFLAAGIRFILMATGDADTRAIFHLATPSVFEFVRPISPDGYVVWRTRDPDGGWSAYQARPGETPERILRFDDPVPGLPGFKYGLYPFNVWPGPGGRVLFVTQLSPETDPIRWGMFLYQSNHIVPIAITGEPAPGEDGLWIDPFGSLTSLFAVPVFAANGDCAVEVGLSTTRKLGDSKAGILRIRDGVARVVCRAGTAPPGDPSSTISHFQTQTMTPLGGILLQGALSGPLSDWACIWQLRDDELSPLIVFSRQIERATRAPGTNDHWFHYARSDVEGASDGTIAFKAEAGPPGDGETFQGLWSGPPDDLRLRARPGQRITGSRPGTLMDFGGSGTLTPGNRGLVAFSGTYQPDDSPAPAYGMFLSRSPDELEVLLSEGMQPPDLGPEWRAVTSSFLCLSSFGDGQFLFSCEVQRDPNFVMSAYLYLDEGGILRTLFVQDLTILHPRPDEAVTGWVSKLAPWESGLGQRRLVTERGLMLLPVWNTRINGTQPENTGIYLVNLTPGTSRLRGGQNPTMPGQFHLSAEVDPQRPYQWEYSAKLQGPWMVAETLWAAGPVVSWTPPLLPSEPSRYFRLIGR